MAVPRKGRGAVLNETNRYERFVTEATHDGWDIEEDMPRLETHLIEDHTRTIIARNDSPDIGFDRSINPYRGCEHGCIYCFARPTHAYLGLSPGLDFESRILFKPAAARLLEVELAAKNYKPESIALGSNTDPYQPVEREKRITRGILEVLQRTRHPVTIVTKSALVLRDIDILAEMAAANLARVALSVTTLDADLARTMEPRASTPSRRIQAIETLAKAGVPVTVMTAPMIPALNDHEMENILERATAAGANSAGMVLVRLPLEITKLFEDWLQAHAPGRAAHVMSLIRQCRGGKTYKADWGTRMTGEGPYADLIRARFRQATRRLGLNLARPPLDTTAFRPPRPDSPQLALF